MSLPTLPPAPQGKAQEYDPCAHLRAYQFKPGHRPIPHKYKITPEIKQILTDNSYSAVKTLCGILRNHKIRPITRYRAAIIILNRVYGEAILPIDVLVDGEINVENEVVNSQ